MNNLQALRGSLSSEIYKYRSTFLLWFAILSPAFIPAINLVTFLHSGDKILARGGTAWSNLMQYSTGPANFLFPFFVMIVALFMNQIENNSNSWKLIYAQQNPRWSIYLAKVITYCLILFLGLTLYMGLTYAVGKIVHIVNPELGFGAYFSFWKMIERSLMLFIGTLGFASIQFWLGQRFKNLMISLGIGVGGIISFMIVAQGWKYARFHPYGFHMLAGSGVENDKLILWQQMEPLYLSLGLALVVFILAGIDMNKRRII